MFKTKKKAKPETDRMGQLKHSNFDFDRISLYFKHVEKNDAFQVVDENTCLDLDFEELFMFVDRTSSALGQQYLYATLRTIKDEGNDRFENLIDQIAKQPDIKEKVVSELNRLSGPGSYYLQQLIYGDIPQKPSWFKWLPLLSILSFGSAVLSFIYPTMMLVFLLLASVNSLIHYWNKNNVIGYSNTIPKLILLTKITKAFLKLNVFQERITEVKKSERELRRTLKMAFIFKWESKMTDELSQFFDYILDFLKGIFLIEPIFLFSILERLDRRRSDILELFNAVSILDVAISISLFRNSLPSYSKPHFVEDSGELKAVGLYHPLTINPVANDIHLSNGKSMLITGSNMSGKSTMIRAIGINVLLAQTINTVCSTDFWLPKTKIYSAIRISDDLMDETSYYYAEVKRIKELLKESSSGAQNLFLLDELFKGTNTVERIASGKAVLSFLNEKGNFVFASTHDLELTEYLSNSYCNYHFSEMVENDLISFDYLLREGKLDHTNAIRILELNNFPTVLTEEAKKLAKEIYLSKKSSLLN
ncbi:MutS-related protein [Reichenbachiella sp.]